MSIVEIMAAKGQPSLKAIAGVFETNPVRLYAVAKQPKEGEVYDAKVYNWDAIERFITRRLDADKGIVTVEDVIDKALEIDQELKEKDGRRSGNRGDGVASYGAKIEVDGKLVAKRRFASFEMENGQFVVLKKDPEVYVIVLQTLSHTVLRPIDHVPAEGEELMFKGNDVKVISNLMLNMKGFGPSALQEAIEKRMSGEYAKEVAEAAQKAADEAKEAATKGKKSKAKAEDMVGVEAIPTTE